MNSNDKNLKSFADEAKSILKTLESADTIVKSASKMQYKLLHLKLKSTIY